MSKLTRRGARNVTATLDRIASVIQENPEVLGIDPKIAMDFAHRCDLISDAIETTAAINYPRKAAEKELAEDADPKSDDQNKPEHFEGKKAGEMGLDEEGLSIDNDGWDEDQIADMTPGPHQHEADEAHYMATFNEEEFHELGQLQEGGMLENGAKSASKSSHGFNLFA
jgi:hypothetical protein